MIFIRQRPHKKPDIALHDDKTPPDNLVFNFNSDMHISPKSNDY